MIELRLFRTGVPTAVLLGTLWGAIVVAGCSGGTANNSDAAVSALGCTDPDPGVLDFVDNMEDGDAPILKRDGRNGSWYAFHDATPGTLTPDMGVTPTMDDIPGKRCGVSTRAMRVTGSGFSEWGSGFGFGFNTVQIEGVWTTAAYDASRFHGITFWARTGETSVGSIRMGIGDEWSVPQGGHCDVTLASGDTACWDHFGANIPLTSTWKRYTFQFGELQQRMFGIPRDGLQTDAVHFVEFMMPPSSPVFDIWMDDVALF
jgi:endoglucanase